MQMAQEIPIVLISPGDGEKIPPERGVEFVWTGTGLKGPYSLKIAEMKAGQSPEQAIMVNRAFFEKTGIATTSFRCQSEETKFIPLRKYAWIIASGHSDASRPRSFYIGAGEIFNKPLRK